MGTLEKKRLVVTMVTLSRMNPATRTAVPNCHEAVVGFGRGNYLAAGGQKMQKAVLAIVVGLAITAMLAGCGGQSPQSALETFAKEVSAPGVDMFSTSVTGMLTKDKLDKLKTSETGNSWYETAADALRGGIRIEGVKDTGGIATIKHFSKADNKVYTAALVKEDGFWRIQDYSTLKEALDKIMDSP
jgi:hypothetical protein